MNSKLRILVIAVSFIVASIGYLFAIYYERFTDNTAAALASMAVAVVMTLVASGLYITTNGADVTQKKEKSISVTKSKAMVNDDGGAEIE